MHTGVCVHKVLIPRQYPYFVYMAEFFPVKANNLPVVTMENSKAIAEAAENVNTPLTDQQFICLNYTKKNLRRIKA